MTTPVKKVSKQELHEIVMGLIREVAGKTLTEGPDFTARRTIQQAAQRVSFEFEDEIRQVMNLNPDQMQDEVQRHYHTVVENMKQGIVKAVMTCVDTLAKFPTPPPQADGSSKPSSGT